MGAEEVSSLAMVDVDVPDTYDARRSISEGGLSGSSNRSYPEPGFLVMNLEMVLPNWRPQSFRCLASS